MSSQAALVGRKLTGERRQRLAAVLPPGGCNVNQIGLALFIASSIMILPSTLARARLRAAIV